MNYPTGPADPAFPTRNGTAQRPDNVRSRILARVHERANELLAKDGRLPIAHMTPHTLRRTFASILAAANVPPRRAMYPTSPARSVARSTPRSPIGRST